MSGLELLASYRRKRCEQAFAELVRRYAGLVCSVARRHLPDSALAEEATQAVFVRLSSANPKFEKDGALACWLHRTAVHVSIDLWRAETRRSAREQEHAALMQVADTEPPWAELEPHLDRALNQLADEDRAVILLRFFDQRRMAEIGRALGVSEDAAKMRVSRAVDRLRSQLKASGIACSAAGLCSLLPANSVLAAPVALVARIVSLRLTAPVTATGLSLVSLPVRVVMGLAGAAVIVLYSSWPSHTTHVEAQAATPVPEVRTDPEPRSVNPLPVTPVAQQDSAAVRNCSLVLHVVNAETGRDIPNAKIRAAYFYAGGVAEPHHLETDTTGHAGIPRALRGDNPGMNVFVSAEHHVPKCLMWERKMGPEYTMKLDPAVAIGGLVVDEEDKPVEGVNIEIVNYGQTGELKPEHPSFHGGNSRVSSDAHGRWLCPYVPVGWESVRLIMTRSGYAVTEVNLSTTNLHNNKVVIRRGYTIAGHVRDTNGLPLTGVIVRESHNYGRRHVAGRTDANGQFELQGIVDFYQGTREGASPQANLTLQTSGYACKMETVKLLEATNNVTFTMEPGYAFHGRVVDEDGYPIVGAVVRTDADNEGLVKFSWLTETDRDGRFSWNSAPQEPTLFWFQAKGFEWIRGLSLLPEGTAHEIVMKRNPK